MKLLVFGQPESYAQRRDFQRQLDRLGTAGAHLEEVSTESRDGIARMEVYGVVTTPALVVVNDEGSVLALWQHEMPSFDDVRHALNQAI